jgi:uncharacterized membrane protein YczE
MKHLSSVQHISLPTVFSFAVLRRWAQFALGIVTMGFGITLMVRAQVGLGPWDVLHEGVSMRMGTPLGTATIVVGALVMLLWWPLGERPGPGTLLNMLCLGLVVNELLTWIPPLQPDQMQAELPWLVQVMQMLAGVVLIGIGAGLYMSAGFGAGPRDGVMMGLVRHTGLSVRLIRTLMELTALTSGWLLGGTVGLGTLAFALGVGPVIQATLGVIKHAQGRPVPTRPQP